MRASAARAASVAGAISEALLGLGVAGAHVSRPDPSHLGVDVPQIHVPVGGRPPIEVQLLMTGLAPQQNVAATAPGTVSAVKPCGHPAADAKQAGLLEASWRSISADAEARPVTASTSASAGFAATFIASERACVRACVRWGLSMFSCCFLTQDPADGFADWKRVPSARLTANGLALAPQCAALVSECPSGKRA